MAAAAEAARAAEKLGRSGLSAGGDDAAAGGDTVCIDGRAGGVDDRGGTDEISGAADRVECLRADSVDDSLRYGNQDHACDVPARVCRPPRHWLLKGKKRWLSVESIWYAVLS